MMITEGLIHLAERRLQLYNQIVFIKKEGESMTQNDIEYASRVFTERAARILKNHIKKIIMYGSCARGDFDSDSDVDIAIITDMDRKAVKKYDSELMDAVTDIAMNSDAVVEYICLPVDEYNDKKGWYGYYKNIETEGRTLYEHKNI